VTPELAFPSAPVPDRVSIWPIENGTYGLDATYQGATGYERVDSHRSDLERAGIDFSLRQELGGAWTLRFGPLPAAQVSLALAAFVR
jgi:hypothetical protein